MEPRYIKGTIVKLICGAAAFFAGAVLILIIVTCFVKGLPSLNLKFLLVTETQSGGYAGIGKGIANAIVGTFLLATVSTVLALPFGIGTAIYLQRYAPDNRYTRFLRFMIEVLSGTPSIVLGLFGVIALVVYLKPITGGESLFAGAIALGALVLPVVIRATEDAIIRVPKDLEEGSYALGATKWLTLRDLTIPYALSGIIVAAILSFGRAAEESAIVILTAGYSQYSPEFKIALNPNFLLGIKIYPLNDLVGTIPVLIYSGFENSIVYPASFVFAAAFVLICIVLLINLSAKMILYYSTRPVSTHRTGTPSLAGRISGLLPRTNPGIFRIKNTGTLLSDATIPAVSATQGSLYGASPVSANSDSPAGQNPGDLPERTAGAGRPKPDPAARFRNLLDVIKQKLNTSPVPDTKDPLMEPSAAKIPAKGDIKKMIRPFLRAFLPFTIPIVILVLIAILANVPPVNHLLGPATPSLAGLFSTLLMSVIAIAGLGFGLFFAKKRGAFREKTLKAGFAGVAAGFCIVLVAAVVLSTAATGFFMTGDETGTPPVSSLSSSSGDRDAQLAALIASESVNSAGAATQDTNTVTNVAVTLQPPSSQSSSGGAGTVPFRDALSLHEYYQYGDSSHSIRATVYDSKVLPFYFWWWIDYNRFVQAVPAPGNQFLVVFVRLENTGDKSAIIPSADQFNVTYNGESYGHLAFFNTSVLSAWQIDYYGTHPDKFPYQWIRELGQNKRDYSYLMGYNIFNNNLTSNATATTTTTATPTPTPSSSDATGFTENGVTDMDYLNYNLKPGPSQAIDGYLIYEVPDAAVHDLKNTYMYVAFNGRSATRWRLG